MARRSNLLEALSDNIVIDKSKCVFCGVCVETCILDNLRMKLAPCRQGCPLGANVQGYVQETLRGQEDKAREILRDTLIFPEILGRICPAPCETACHRGQVGDAAVSARALKRYLVEGQTAEDIPIPDKAEASGKKAAIVGSGPAGLQAAHDLALAGHAVTVFEAADKPGGMLRFAIPEFRLPPEVLDRELSLLDKLGVEFKCSQALGKDISLDSLQNDYDAVVLAVGCGRPARLGIEGHDADQVVYGLDLLKAARTGQGPELTGRVVVIGGGNVAVDSAQVALRLGAAQVNVVSLEGAEDLPAFPEEVEQARSDGVVFEHSWGPARFQAQSGEAVQVELHRCLAVFDEKGRFAPQMDSCELKTMEAETIILAVGQMRDESIFTGLDEPDPLTLQVDDSNLFLAGDCLTGPSSVVAAMAGGREAAESVSRLLKGEHLAYGRAYPGPVETDFEIDTSGGTDAARAVPPSREFSGRGDFAELEGALDQETARTEAGRCYSCGQPFGKFRTCWFCLPCEVECPEEALWVEIPYLLR